MSCLTGPSSVFKIVKMIMERNFQPVIIFSFSKKECEAYALQVAKLDFNGGMCVVKSTRRFVWICEMQAERNPRTSRLMAGDVFLADSD